MEERKYLDEMLLRHPNLKELEENVWEGYCLLRECFENHGKILTCGNGGSAADADHIVGELMKGFRKRRALDGKEQELYRELAEGLQGALPAISLTQHTALMTAFSNDVRPDMVFAQQIYGYGNQGDLLWALSTSGNSENVVKAARVASKRGMKILAMTGKSGGALGEISDICIRIPETETAFVQEGHIIIYHTLCSMIEERFFGEGQKNRVTI